MKLRHALTLSLFISGSVFAATSANTVRTSSRQLISVGDSFAEMNTRIAQSPISMQTYEKKEGKTTVTVSNYTYEIDQINYTFTVIDKQIRKIEWIRKAP
ncbi:hypothetical protein [Acinetobacter sp.]|jgi:hypothetical protein|uniref:hypothetical protein n=1 Tax=Acinetobacter sp. TaxID=472 RepID=UPI002819C1F3|nr:hypothetical protein [Acinetobacter sp.]MDR0236308.1 hypothetical protein [Acinetobacter sp.]